MSTKLLQDLTLALGAVWRTPLTFRQAVLVAISLFLSGTVYCQLYCMIALPATAGAMPPLLSMGWAAVTVIPTFAAFEISKRILAYGKNKRRVAIVAALLTATSGLSMIGSLWLHDLVYDMIMPVRPLIAGRLPALIITAVAVGLTTHVAAASHKNANRADTAGYGDSMPPVSYIDWIRASGNYVEIRFQGRTVLMRMTLAQAADVLGPGQFVRIHRSVIINRDRIATWDRSPRPRHVRLIDGTGFKVSESYRGTIRV